MEVALTFGSLGDITALCRLAVQLGRAIGTGKDIGESAKEYQALWHGLELFVKVLMQICLCLAFCLRTHSRCYPYNLITLSVYV